MKTSKSASVEQFQLISRFDSLRRTLCGEPYIRHLQRPLAYWALPSDRRLPLTFLGKPLGELLHTPYADLAATPGIGQKKMRSFVKLLARVASGDPGDLPSDLVPPADMKRPSPRVPSGVSEFRPAEVSELVWTQWRMSAVQHGFGPELLGRLAPSLKGLTRVIWNTPLNAYADKSLAEIRAMKTHGEKRVRAILEVFHGVYAIVSQMGVQEHLVVRVVPRWIDAVDTWIVQVLQRPGLPDEREIAGCFVYPLLQQLRRDASRQIVQLAENRLGIHGPTTSVRQASRALGLTRARVYQLLGEINDIMTVRWPLGRHQVYELYDKIHSEWDGAGPAPGSESFRAAIELFYPAVRRNVVEPPHPHIEPDDLHDLHEGNGEACRDAAERSSTESIAG